MLRLGGCTSQEAGESGRLEDRVGGIAIPIRSEKKKKPPGAVARSLVEGTKLDSGEATCPGDFFQSSGIQRRIGLAKGYENPPC